MKNNTTKELMEAIDFLTQSCYNFQRASGESPERLKLIWSDNKVSEMEKAYKRQRALSGTFNEVK